MTFGSFFVFHGHSRPIIQYSTPIRHQAHGSQGIHALVLYIEKGSEVQKNKEVYGDAFLDITDLTKLPVKLAGIIKRYIRY